ncbi:DUF2147 domain-containing protein [Luteimonas sp. SJ-92]|uniref:DUF2147 domain-containing protein n=1 Tax=Luteimonas salinisoli TaxID=2752307 RepID=A0A853JB95_9GAMM|nr:DUF2147 domain-containing protein [Luteimonas salinisoli]NZA25898.1 DUF2147 domain-containing protein [Luteimonas salinisoli]
MSIRSIAFVVLAALPLIAGAQDGPAGRWKTIDDETGKPKSIVEITQAADGTLSGRVVEVLQSDRGPNPTCDKCSGERKDQPIEGMTILWDLKPDGQAWSGGTILDPAKGKTYRSKAQLIDPNRLGVSGCVAFICREQVWQRE